MKSAFDTATDIAAGKTDPVELVEKTLETIDNDPKRNEIYARLTPERARREAEASRQRQKSGNMLGPLDGVPISWKDLFDTAGVATESGSQLLKGRTPDKDALALQRASTAGTVCIGKTHLSELAFSGLGINPKAATSPNIHGDHLAPGGSSSGAAASVAFGHVPIGIGSDTGGSVRIPSAWNDLTGFKTTHGLIPGEGIVPLCKGFDTAGPLCTNLTDAWLITAIMAGLPPVKPAEKPVDQCRFLVSETFLQDDISQEQKEGFELAVTALEKAGASIVHQPVPEIEHTLPLGPILFPYEAWQQWGDAIEANPERMFEPIRMRFSSGKGVTQVQYQESWSTMLDLRRTFGATMSSYDALLAPTVPIDPPEIAPLLEDFELFGATNMKALRNTRVFNIFGCCALSLPTSSPASGLMVVAAGGEDEHLASIGLGIEKVLP